MVKNMRMEHVTDKLLEVHFSISNEELEFINKARGYINQLGVAVCLKVYIFLGCLPRRKDDIPEQIINWIAKQLNLDSNIFEKYIWQSRSWMRHLVFIREFTGFRAYETNDREVLSKWISEQKDLHPTKKNIETKLIDRLRELKIELPSNKELKRLTNSSRRKYFTALYERCYEQFDASMVNRMTESLTTDDRNESYNWMKSPPGKLGLKTILDEIDKLKYIRSFNINSGFYEAMSSKLIQEMYRRCRVYDASHLSGIRLSTNFATTSEIGG